LKKQGIRTSRSALWRFFSHHDITFKKKSLCASERQRQDVVWARRKWVREQGLLDPARLVFIDETSVNTQMVRLYGHEPRGCGSSINRKTFAFVAALRHNRMVAPLLIDGAMNGETFRAYIEQFVVPILKRNDIVPIDNLPAHNAACCHMTGIRCNAKVDKPPSRGQIEEPTFIRREPRVNSGRFRRGFGAHGKQRLPNLFQTAGRQHEHE
jgi:transposase